MDKWKKPFPKQKVYYETNNTILYNDNALNTLELIPNESIDLVVTSPPYDDLRSYDGKVEWNFDIFKKMAILLSKKIKKGGVIVWIVGDATKNGSETGTSFKQVLFFKEECGLNIHDTMIYQKSGFAFPSNVRYHQVFEYMFILSKGKLKTFNPIKDRKNRWKGKRGFGYRYTLRQKNGKLKEKERPKIGEYGMRFNIWKYATGYGFGTKDKMAFKHPAIFPEQLAKDHIISWSNEEDIVLDPMCGSGTTLKMAELLNRKQIGIEINSEYCEIIKERLENIFKKGSLLF